MISLSAGLPKYASKEKSSNSPVSDSNPSRDDGRPGSLWTLPRTSQAQQLLRVLQTRSTCRKFHTPAQKLRLYLPPGRQRTAIELGQSGLAIWSASLHGLLHERKLSQQTPQGSRHARHGALVLATRGSVYGACSCETVSDLLLQPLYRMCRADVGLEAA